jgi:peptidoglycan/LPS O-acetylase OafA/YrhL
MEKQKIYFPNLNGLRFIAAFLVIVHHTEQIKAMYSLESYWKVVPFVTLVGKLGVVLFFVLSGFLITYLLLSEEHSFRNVNIKSFYIRRILRIWPLYFLILGLSFFVFPFIPFFLFPGYTPEIVHENLAGTLFLYSVFSPNLSVALFGSIPYASHLWSIGTEEQFYLVWPVIIRYIHKFRIWVMLLIIACYWMVKRKLDFYQDSDPSDFHLAISTFWNLFNINCMAIGALFAILLYKKSPILALIQNRILFYATLILTSYLLFQGVKFSSFHYEIYSVLFGVIILNFASNPGIGITLENPVFNYLGNISYGLYMYHPIGIILALKLLMISGFITNWILYPLALGFTILFAGVSYKWYESYFLKFKPRFSKIISGADTKKAE